MLKWWIIVLAAIISFSNTIFGQDSTPTQTGKEWKVSYSGYFQIMANTIQQSFDMPYAKVFIDGKSGRQRSFHLELRPASGNPLVKAYLGYSFNPFLNVILGQLSNPIKYVEPQPEEKQFIYYSLYTHYVANGDDIGIAVFGKRDRFFYYSCIVNGTGRNTSDNNTAKDVSAYFSYAFSPALQVEIAGQTGKQPEGNRDAGFARITLSPLLNLRLKAVVMGRTDLDDWGWYLAGDYIVRKFQVMCRVHQTSQSSKPEWTFGFQTGGIPLKFQMNAIVGSARHPEVVAVVQMFIQ